MWFPFSQYGMEYSEDGNGADLSLSGHSSLDVSVSRPAEGLRSEGGKCSHCRLTRPFNKNIARMVDAE